MSRGNDFRTPRRRGFDDDYAPPSYDQRGGGGGGGSARPPARSFGGGGGGSAVAEGPIVDASVKWFNPEKGFGFVELADGSGDAFLHVNALQSAGHDAVAEGAKLRVQVGQGQKGKQVTNVLEVDTSSARESAPRSSAPRPKPGARAAIDPSTAVEVSGTVKWYNPEKGFGFIAGDDGRKDIFVHVSVIEAAGLSTLGEGQQVSVRVVETPKGREAISVSAGR